MTCSTRQGFKKPNFGMLVIRSSRLTLTKTKSDDLHVENRNQIHKSESSFVARVLQKQTT